MASDACEKCGVVYGVGDWPFCPHGAVKNFAIEPNDWPGGKTFEHMGHEPVTCYSRSEYERELDQRGLRPTDRWHPNDGTPNPRACIDAYTLDCAKALVARQGEPKGDPGRLETLTLTERHVTLKVGPHA